MIKYIRDSNEKNINKNNKKICEIPIRLYKDGRGGKSHLKTVKDGFRHLNYIIRTRK